ncbi:MAG TPA: M48 family metalloprotease [Candidatus Margulisiibacteriota bacterium]|nr:M48 family metalloprotease [Candidatus Margulisiibacteriota bacterium]
MRHQRCITIVICALVCNPAAARLVHAGSISDEKQLGKQFDLEARAQLPLIDDVEVTSYIDRIGQRIASNLNDQTFQYQFSVVRDPRINAFAVPGGYVYVHGGLLTRAANDDELAGVLGHEIAHVNAHHLARQQEATQLMNYATLLGVLLSAVQPAIGAGAVAANAAVQLQYRREFEQEADYLGARYMQQAGYDPRGMLDFFKKMLDEQRTTPTFAPPYLLSHPLTETRLTNLEAVLHTHQWDSGPRQPSSMELERVQAVVRARSEPPQDVVTYYRRQAEAQPSDGRARYLLGVAQLETGAFEAARQSLEVARQLGFAGVDRELGRTALRLQQLDKARELLSRAAEIAPNDPVAHYELGKVLEAQNDTAGALREYERAFQLAPTLADAHYGFGILAGRSGQAGDGYYHLGRAYKLRGEYDKALSQFEKAEPLFTTGTPRGQEVRAEIAELKEYLRHGSGKPRRG